MRGAASGSDWRGAAPGSDWGGRARLCAGLGGRGCERCGVWLLQEISEVGLGSNVVGWGADRSVRGGEPASYAITVGAAALNRRYVAS